MDYDEDTKYADNQSEALMEANNLVYKFDQPLSVSTFRTNKNQYFATRNYNDKSGTMIVDFNSGTDALDCKNSYLKITIGVGGGDVNNRYTFGSGSIMNIINNVKILSSSGVELSRSENANIHHKFSCITRNSLEWYGQIGRLMGTPDNPNMPYEDDENRRFTPGDGRKTFLIPLTELDPFFRLYDDKLMPSVLASGLRIELGLENVNQAFYRDPGIGPGGTFLDSYVIDDIVINTESVTLVDSAQAVLNSEASKDGLEIQYDRYFVAPSAVGTDLTANIEVRKAVALAKNTMTVLLNSNHQNNIQFDSFNTLNYSYTSVDSRIGSMYVPHIPLKTPEESFFYLKKNHGSIKYPHNTSALEFIPTNNVNTEGFFATGNAIISFNYERADSLALSGLPVNNSRVCEVRLERNDGTSAKAYTFMCYTALARVSLQNCSVKI